ncbi:hypothetical protein CRV00_10005 [Malaciobacter molluscorum]|uniref:hypothetical protein n=1 Tax=Malaciobacter molluscorum TaxID=1032072 RepID=UPI00100B8AA6|nr:hypothetical protein [Malaciobacter molluscorum]RXJ93785.1 hypothetical protein CRV00_10005 [Malaciobacter molluscorum]
MQNYYFNISLGLIVYCCISILSLALFIYSKEALIYDRREKIVRIKDFKKQNSFSIAKTYGYGFLCGVFILCLENKQKLLDLDIYLLGLLFLSIAFFIGTFYEESLNKKREYKLSNFLNALDGVFYNLIPAIIIYVINHQFFNNDLKTKDYIFALIVFSFSCNFLSITHLLKSICYQRKVKL